MNRKRKIILLIIGIAAAIAFISLVVPEDLFQPQPPSQTPPEATAPLGPLRGEVSAELNLPRTALVEFLEANSWPKRLPVIYGSDVMQETIANYYRDHDDHNFAGSYDLEFFHMEESIGPGKPYYIYFVTTPKVPQGFPAIVRKKENNYFVDWHSFVEFHDHHFVDFEDDPKAAAGDFRVVIKRAEYWGPDKNSFTDLDKHLCFKVELPYAESDYYAFTKKSDPLAASFEKKVNWGGPPLAGILRFKHHKFSDGNTRLLISHFLTDDWFRPLADE